MTGFVYLAEVDFNTDLGKSHCKIFFETREQAEEFRRKGYKRNYRVTAIYGFALADVKMAIKMIDAEKEIFAQRAGVLVPEKPKKSRKKKEAAV